MTLNEYKNQNEMSYGQLAELLGASHAAVVRRWCLRPTHPDRMIPSTAFMKKIHDLTEGSVQPNDFYCFDEQS